MAMVLLISMIALALLPGNASETSDVCGGESDIASVAAGTFNMSTVGEVNDFLPPCGGGGLQPNAADKIVSFTVSQRSMVEITATSSTRGFDPYIYILSAAGCNTGDVIACDKSAADGYSITLDDVGPGTYFLALSSSTVLGTEGQASIDLTITPINPTTLVGQGALCDQAVSVASELLAFGDFNGDGQPYSLALANGERVSMIQEQCGNGIARLGEACDDGNHRTTTNA